MGQKKNKSKYVLDMNRHNRILARSPVTFKTGGHVTVKDRPRDKNWRSWLDEFLDDSSDI